MGGTYSTYDFIQTCRVGKPKGKRQLGRPRHKYETILKWLLNMRCDGVEWINLAQNRSQ
jgi:hypothetical protein